MLHSINKEQRLYVLSCGNGYSWLGFDVCFDKTIKLAKELNREDLVPKRKGTKLAYKNYNKLVALAHKRYVTTKQQSKVNLVPQLIGKERCRVEVVDCYNEKRRFIVGKSMGWIPCHIELRKSNSIGGHAVTGAPFKSIRVVEYNV